MVRRRNQWALEKKGRRGFRGYPVATLALYGPDDVRASKVVIAMVEAEGREPADLERHFSETGDVRFDLTVQAALERFLRKHAVRTVVVADRIIGCPHEEGIDYPVGEPCPRCPFWADKDRWTGEKL